MPALVDAIRTAICDYFAPLLFPPSFCTNKKAISDIIRHCPLGVYCKYTILSIIIVFIFAALAALILGKFINIDHLFMLPNLINCVCRRDRVNVSGSDGSGGGGGVRSSVRLWWRRINWGGSARTAHPATHQAVPQFGLVLLQRATERDHGARGRTCIPGVQREQPVRHSVPCKLW